MRGFDMQIDFSDLTRNNEMGWNAQMVERNRTNVF